MTDTKFDVLAIGNAIVDILVHTDDRFLNTHDLIKGTMGLVDLDTSQSLYDKVCPALECSGGSAANTIAGVASLGGRGAFIGKVHDDQLGRVFTKDMRATGVHFETAPTTDGAKTASSLVLVTPDAERTMQTYLGACVELSSDDIGTEDIPAAQVTYLEGYLWDPPAAKQAFIKAIKLARGAGREVSLSLSDPFCVDRHRADFAKLIDGHVDILFANEEEIMSLYQVETFDEAIAAVTGQCNIAALTRSAEGCVIVSGDQVLTLAAETVDEVVDTTGAGDAFAAGFLAGYTQGRDLATSARMANIAAGEAISHLGARPAARLADLVAERTGEN